MRMTEDETRELAYKLWERRGRPIGSPWEDWFAAEQSIPYEHLAFVANNATNALLVHSTRWGSPPNAPVNQKSKFAPAMVQFHARLWLAFVADAHSNGILVCSSEDGLNWSGNTPVHQASKCAPAMVVFNNRLWIFFVADAHSNAILACHSDDGVNWSSTVVLNEKSKCTPAVTVGPRGRLWMVFVADSDSNGLLMCSSADGRNWTRNEALGEASKRAPSLTWYKERLWLAFVANTWDTGEILMCQSAPGGERLSPNTPSGHFSDHAPAIRGQADEYITVLYVDPKDKELCSVAYELERGIWLVGGRWGQFSKDAPARTIFYQAQ